MKSDNATATATPKSLLDQERTLRDKFVHTLGHDLRNPLAALKLSAEMLAHADEFDVDVVRIGERINRISDQMNDVIQNLLDAGQIQAGRGLPQQREPADLRNITETAVREMIETHGPYFELVAGESLPGEFCVNGVRRALVQLLDNGFRYGSNLEPVSVAITRTDEVDTVSVRNRGRLLDEIEQAKFFAAFHRPRDERSEIGWGLGIALAHAVAEGHGGTLTFENLSEGGVVFRMTFRRGGNG